MGGGQGEGVAGQASSHPSSSLFSFKKGSRCARLATSGAKHGASAAKRTCFGGFPRMRSVMHDDWGRREAVPDVRPLHGAACETARNRDAGGLR